MNLPGFEIGLRVPPCRSSGEVADFVRQAEAAGVDSVWMPDSSLLWRDPWVALTVAAERTERIGLGTAVINPVTRHPATIAAAAVSVHEASDGRFRLGMGVGNSSVSPIGLAPASAGEFRAAVGMIGNLLHGQTVEFADGYGGRLHHTPDGGVPVLVAATGPRNLQMGGELADGTILLGATGRSSVRRGLERVQRGRTRPAGPMLVTTHCLVSDDLARDARTLKPVCAAMSLTGGRQRLAEAGIHVEVPGRVPDIYPDLLHAEDWPAAVTACAQWVSDAAALRFAQAFCIAGTAGEVADQLHEIHRAGAAGIIVQHVGSYDFPAELLGALADVRAGLAARQ